MDNLPILSDLNDIQRIEAEYRQVLSQYRKAKGLSAAMQINNKLGDRGWGSGKSHKEFVLDLIHQMRQELANS